MLIKRKSWFILIDLVIASVVLIVMITILWTAFSSYLTNSVSTEEQNYVNFALSECAEVVHSFRYGSLDKSASWWENYQVKYPTGVYKLNYNENAKSWEAKPIYKDVNNKTNFSSFEELLEAGYNISTEGEKFTTWFEWKNLITRYLFINNENIEKSEVTCYVKYKSYYNAKEQDNIAIDDYKLYHRLKFIMTNY